MGEEDFLVSGSNAAAHALVERWPEWPSNAAFLTGPAGSGKSHLASIWAARAGGERLDARALSAAEIAGLAERSAVALENVDAPGVPETALFHLINGAREHRCWLLLTATSAPDLAWPTLPDLASRLRAMPTAALGAPDDDLVRAVLVKLFLDRQLVVDTGVVDYVTRRMERSLASARELVERLDAEALSRGRAVTRAMAAGVLAETRGEDEG